MEQTFSGIHELNLDDKGRVIIPIRYRDALEDGLYVTHGLNGCLWIMAEATWQSVAGKLKTVEVSVEFERNLYAGESTRLDRQGRLTIPARLRKYAGLLKVDQATRKETASEAVVLNGFRNCLEIWQPERWDERAESGGRGAAEKDPHKDLLTKLGL